MKYDIYRKLSACAMRQEKADLVLKNAHIVDVFTDEIRTADIAVAEGWIAAVGSGYEGREEIDLDGKYVLPGFIDAHLHLESTMVTPNELVSLAALHGTTTFIVDPHEAANVSGPAGIDYILDQTADSPANVYVMMPSCVPARELVPDQAPVIPKCPYALRRTVHLDPVAPGIFRLPITKDTVHVIRLDAGQITTTDALRHFEKTENYVPGGGYCKIAALERHKGSGLVGTGICEGYGIRGGAVASSVSHDSHNILVVGDNDEDMASAVNEIIKHQGGYSLVCDGNVYETLPLPVMGLMSEAGFSEVDRKLKRMIQKAHEMGVPEETDPFITLSFLALPVIPQIRITPWGVLDTVNLKYIEY